MPPPGVTASEIGGLQWMQTAGGGTLETEEAEDGSGMYTAPVCN